MLWRVLTVFRQYQPQSVTMYSTWRWLMQFPRELRWDLLALLGDITFVTESQTEAFLAQGNHEVLSRLLIDDLGPANIIYVALDTAGSSSGVMLNVLRDRQNMERRGARFIHSRDGDLMTRFSDELGSGAVVYVDDFAGSGNQFRRNRDAIAPFITGNFAEFFVAGCICEEALSRIEEVGVIPLPGLVHLRLERPLHNQTATLRPERKEALTALSKSIGGQGLGFKRLATMVIFARNAPNSTPLLFRGSLQQNPIRGIFPRWDDLPFSH